MAFKKKDTLVNSIVNTCIQTRLMKGCVHQIPNFPTSVVFLMSHDILLIASDHWSFKFLTYQLAMVGCWLTIDGLQRIEPEKRLPFLRKGRKCANCPILTQGGSDKK